MPITAKGDIGRKRIAYTPLIPIAQGIQMRQGVGAARFVPRETTERDEIYQRHESDQQDVPDARQRIKERSSAQMLRGLDKERGRGDEDADNPDEPR
jgi:hypothetical protein